MDLQYAHIKGIHNQVAEVLSRWQGRPEQLHLLQAQIPRRVWLHVSYKLLDIYPELQCFVKFKMYVGIILKYCITCIWLSGVRFYYIKKL